MTRSKSSHSDEQRINIIDILIHEISTLLKCKTAFIIIIEIPTTKILPKLKTEIINIIIGRNYMIFVKTSTNQLIALLREVAQNEVVGSAVGKPSWV